MARYYITDGHGSYIRKDNYSNKYVPIRNINMAEVFEQRSQAQNVLRNCIGKKLRRNYFIEEVGDAVVPQPLKFNKIALKNDKDTVAKTISKEELKPDQTKKWADGAEELKTFLFDAEKRKNELVEDLRHVDREISDIEHYIEIGRFNAYQGWLAFSMLKGRLIKRRKIKDELNVIVRLKSCKVTSDTMIDINNAIKAYQNRQYKPRVLKELFD